MRANLLISSPDAVVASQPSALARLLLAKSEQDVAEAVNAIGIQVGIGNLLLACRNRLNLLANSNSESDAGFTYFPGFDDNARDANPLMLKILKVFDSFQIPSYPFSIISDSYKLNTLDLLPLLEGKRLFLPRDTDLLSAPLRIVDREYFLAISLARKKIDFELLARLQIVQSATEAALCRVLENQAPRMVGLSARERQVLRWCCQGKTSFEISRILQISEYTVNNYIGNLTKKLGAANRSHSIAIAVHRNII